MIKIVLNNSRNSIFIFFQNKFWLLLRVAIWYMFWENAQEATPQNKTTKNPENKNKQTKQTILIPIHI